MNHFKKIFFCLSISFILLCNPLLTSFLNAQTKYFFISICKTHKELQDKGYGKCLTCYKSVSSQSKRAKICEACWAEKGGLWNIGCRFCKENVVGGDYARVCSDCAEKDECVECKEKLYSIDASGSDNRKVIGKYLIKVTVHGQKEKFQEYLNSASNAMAKEEYEQAITYFKKCEEIIPNSMACNIGIALRELNKNEEALNYFDIAIKDEPNWADPYGEKGITLAYLGKWNEAGPLFKKSIDLNYDSPTVFWMYGKYIEEILKKPSEAIPFYEKVIAKNPKSYKLYNNIGDIYFNQEKFEDAEKAYKKILEYYPKDFNALAFSGEIKFKKQNFEEALKYYLRAHEIKPDNLELNFHMGICYAYTGQFEKAEKHFKHDLSINPNLSDVSLELARLYTYQKRFGEAAAIYKKLIADDAVTHPAYLDLALCQYMNKEYTSVIESCKKFIEKDTGNYPDPYKWMALAAARLNKFSEAESYCKKAIELNTQNQNEIFYFVAAAYSLMNKPAESLQNLETAFKGGTATQDAETDSEFDNIKSLEKFKDLINKYKSTAPHQQNKKDINEEAKQVVNEEKEPIPLSTELLREDFEDENCVFKPDEIWTLSEGKLVFSNPSDKNSTSWIRLTKIYSDVTFSVNTKWNGKATNLGFGLLFGSEGNNFYSFVIAQDGHYKLSKWFNSEWSNLFPWKEITLKPSGFNKLMVSTSGTKIKCYLNDELLIDIEDNSFSAGKVGLCCNSKVSAAFDDFVIYKN